jgi:hypothetical protein
VHPMLLSVAMCVVAVHLPAQPVRGDQVTGLDAFLGRDLWKPPFDWNRRVAALLGEERCQSRFFASNRAMPPWHIWETSIDGQTRYVVLSADQMMSIPGGSSACVQLFDGSGKQIAEWSFHTGWRTDLVDAELKHSPHTGSLVLSLKTTPVMNGGWQIGYEYFALRNDHVALIRIETATGEPLQNEYVHANQEIGLVPEAHTLEDWAKMLESNDDIEMLSALVFLGGRHIAPADDPDAPGRSQYAELFEQLLTNPRIREAIERLAKSDDEWVRQAATLASRGPRDRTGFVLVRTGIPRQK